MSLVNVMFPDEQPTLTLLSSNEAPVKIERAGITACPCLALIDLYHEILPEAARVVILNDARRRGLKARWRELAVIRGYENRDDGLAEWTKLFRYCRESKFLMGKTRPTQGNMPFELSIDFLLRPSRFTDLIEGKYHRG